MISAWEWDPTKWIYKCLMNSTVNFREPISYTRSLRSRRSGHEALKVGMKPSKWAWSPRRRHEAFEVCMKATWSLRSGHEDLVVAMKPSKWAWRPHEEVMKSSEVYFMTSSWSLHVAFMTATRASYTLRRLHSHYEVFMLTSKASCLLHTLVTEWINFTFIIKI